MAATARQVVPQAGALLTAAVAAAAAGTLLGLVATRFGPWAPALVVLVGVGLVAVLVDLSWAVVALVLSLPFGLLQVGPLEVVQVAAALLVAWAMFVVATTGRQVAVGRGVAVALGGVLLVAGASTAGSIALDLSVPALGNLVLGALLMIAVTAAVDNPARIRRTVTVLVVVGAGVAVAAASSVGRVTAAFDGAVVSGRAGGIFEQPNELGAFTAALVVLAVGLWAGSRTHLASMVAVASVAALATALLLSLSRGAWVGTVTGLAALVLLLLRHRWARRRLLSLGAGLVVVAPTVAIIVGDSGAVRAVTARAGSMLAAGENPYDARPEIYDLAQRQILDAPLLGRGPGTFVASYAGSTRVGTSGQAEHAHNVVLTLTAETGLLGLLAFAALAATVLLAGRSAVRELGRRVDGRDAALCAGAVGALVTVLGHGLVDYPLRNPLLFLLHWLLAGLVLACARVALGHGTPVRDRSGR